MMPKFSERAKLEQYKQEIRRGRKLYKDFYLEFRESFLEQIDEIVANPENIDFGEA